MSWLHIQGASGAVASNVSTLSVTFSGAVTAGHLIECGITNWNSGPLSFTVTDNKSNGAYNILGPYVSANNDQVGRAWLVVSNGGGAGTFTVTLTFAGPSTGAMSIDEYSFSSGAIISVDSSGSNSSGVLNNPILAGNLTVTGTDLVVATVAGGPSLGSAYQGAGFTVTCAIPSSVSEGLATEYQLNVTSAINPGFFDISGAWAEMAVAYLATIPSGVPPFPSLIFPNMYFPSMIEE